VSNAAPQLGIDIGPHEPLVDDCIDVGALAAPLDLLHHGLLLNGLQVGRNLQAQRGQGIRLKPPTAQDTGVKVQGAHHRLLEGHNPPQRGVARLLPQLVEGILRAGEGEELHARVLARVGQTTDDAAPPDGRHLDLRMRMDMLLAPNLKCWGAGVAHASPGHEMEGKLK